MIIQLNQYLSKTVLTQTEQYNFHEGGLTEIVSQFGVEELDWPAQSSDLSSNTFGMNWNIDCGPTTVVTVFTYLL